MKISLTVVLATLFTYSAFAEPRSFKVLNGVQTFQDSSGTYWQTFFTVEESKIKTALKVKPIPTTLNCMPGGKGELKFHKSDGTDTYEIDNMPRRQSGVDKLSYCRHLQEDNREVGKMEPNRVKPGEMAYHANAIVVHNEIGEGQYVNGDRNSKIDWIGWLSFAPIPSGK